MLPSSRYAPEQALRGGVSLARRAVAVLWLTVAAAVFGSGLPRATADDKQEKPLPPEEVTLKASDGVSLAATFYPSRQGKDAAAIVLMHAYRGNRGDFAALALKLQDAGHAVIAPDLRGHGESSPIDGELRPVDFAAMVRQDLEAVKRFLVDKNNAGELNIERLGVVGVEMGASLAVIWAALDWSWPVLATGKQGQDVKALALVSPEWSFRGMRINDAIAQPNVRSDLSCLIVVGQRNSKLLQEAKRLHNALARYHPTPPPGEADAKQTLWLKSPRTSLQGTQLMNEKTLKVDQMIVEFVKMRLVDPPFPWRERKSPLQ